MWRRSGPGRAPDACRRSCAGSAAAHAFELSGRQAARGTSSADVAPQSAHRRPSTVWSRGGTAARSGYWWWRAEAQSCAQKTFCRRRTAVLLFESAKNLREIRIPAVFNIISGMKRPSKPCRSGAAEGLRPSTFSEYHSVCQHPPPRRRPRPRRGRATRGASLCPPRSSPWSPRARNWTLPGLVWPSLSRR